MNNFVEQTAFITGEISPEVASRSELDKYQYALLKARNVHIRPYGSTYRRTGTKYHTACKYGDKKAILVEFCFAVGISYYLEIGDKYIRIHRDGKYLGIELITPFTEADLSKLRFAQSADVMYIASGKYPVQTLSRYSESDWRLAEFEVSNMYFDVNSTPAVFNGASYETAGSYEYLVPADGEYQIEIAGAGGGGGSGSTFANIKKLTGGTGGNGELKTITKTYTKGNTISVIVGAGGAGGGGDGKTGGTSTADDISAQGGGGGLRPTYTDDGANGISYGNGGKGGKGGYGAGSSGSKGQDGWARISYLGNTTITPSDLTGEITLTANKNIFTEKSVGAYLKIDNLMPSKTVSTSGGTTENVTVGESWKIITHGTWSGNVTVQKYNNGTWEEYRKYTSNNDFNASESGTVDSVTELRAVVSGGANVDLTALPYTNEGVVKIIEYVSPTEVKAKVIEKLGSTEPTTDYFWGAWSEENGYPSSVCFFQDRLCFAATSRQPYVVWMSRSGDYTNFSVEKADGTVTDDSAISASFISRKQYNILHLVPTSDLMVLTEGNEWLISGASTVTPTSITPKTQTSRGTTDVEPVHIGSKIVFVQRRGKVVRDIGYSFEADQYDGTDLTILAKHLTKDTEIIDCAYQQEPDNTLYFVTADGYILCLTYVQDQNVYAWSRLETDGQFESVCNIESETQDTVYAVVKRNINGEDVRYIESFANYPDTDNPDDYVMLDSAIVLTNVKKETSEYSAQHLAGKTIDILADGRAHKGIKVDENGNFEIPVTATNVIAGLPYETVIEVPNIAINGPDGSLQGRYKKISDVYVRLYNSLGGNIGHVESNMDEIKFNEFSEAQVKLYSGTKRVTAPNIPEGGYLDNSSILIKTDDPYPFNLSLVVRSVSL